MTDRRLPLYPSAGVGGLSLLRPSLSPSSPPPFHPSLSPPSPPSFSPPSLSLSSCVVVWRRWSVVLSCVDEKERERGKILSQLLFHLLSSSSSSFSLRSPCVLSVPLSLICYFTPAAAFFPLRLIGCGSCSPASLALKRRLSAIVRTRPPQD